MADEKRKDLPDPRTCPHTYYRLEARGSAFLQVPSVGVAERGIARVRLICSVCRSPFPLFVGRTGVCSDDASVSEDGFEIRIPFVKPDLRVLLDEVGDDPEDPPTVH